jgi:hypothetical protein
MASSITSRRPSDPSRLEIEARKAELQAQAGWNVPERNYLAEANGLLLEQCDDEEDYRDPRQVEEWLPVPKKAEPGEPQEMTREDICNIDLGSLFALNIVPKRLSDRYTLGDVDPEAMDIGADSLADFQAATHRPIPMALKTETSRDVVAFRSKRR